VIVLAMLSVTASNYPATVISMLIPYEGSNRGASNPMCDYLPESRHLGSYAVRLS